MPIYQYECTSCDNSYEVRQSFHDEPLNTCATPGCSGSPQRVISPVGIVFKGSGFYINDSKKSKNSASKPAPVESTAPTKTESKSDSPTTKAA
jgi:putative FmdB family regulatory protein